MEKITELEKLILTEIYSKYDFIPCYLEGVVLDRNEESGLLERVFLLSELLKLTNLTREKDSLILDALSSIAKRGLVNIHILEITHDMDTNDIRIKIYLGFGKREVGSWHLYKALSHTQIKLKFTILRRHDEQPLTLQEMKKFPPILNVREVVEGIRKNRDESFQKSMGNTDDSVRKADREATKKYIEAEHNYRRAVLEVADFIKGGEEEKSEQKETD